MSYTKKEHKRNIINGMVSSLVVAVFIGVLYDTNNWWAAFFMSALYGVPAFWISWFLVKDKNNK